MNALTEGGIRIEFPDDLSVRKFDDSESHGRLHRGMQAVDFIVDLPARFLFIEVKEPRELLEEDVAGRDSNAEQEERKEMNLRGVVRKFRDSFVYEWAEGRAGEKPIFYIVLIGRDEVDAGALTRRMENLRRSLPLLGPSDRPWKRPLVEDCVVMDIARWNRHKLTRKFPAARVA